MMRLLYSILFIITTITGCAKHSDFKPAATHMTDTTTTSVHDSSTYLALGDSYTIGEAVPHSQSFPYQLAAALKADKVESEPTIIATTGWTTDNLINAISNSNVTGKKFNIVTLLIGVNDQYQGLSQDNYKIKFKQLLNTAIDFANGERSHVFVLSIPDYGVTPFAQGREATIGPLIDQFNAINRSISTDTGVNYLDITPISRQAAIEPELIASDGLHPSGKMYSLWVEQLNVLVKQKI